MRTGWGLSYVSLIELLNGPQHLLPLCSRVVGCMTTIEVTTLQQQVFKHGLN